MASDLCKACGSRCRFLASQQDFACRLQTIPRIVYIPPAPPRRVGSSIPLKVGMKKATFRGGFGNGARGRD